jgi:hypothetical protein
MEVPYMYNYKFLFHILYNTQLQEDTNTRTFIVKVAVVQGYL